MKKNYRRIARLSLVLVYLVICAGAVVRMTGSGMGCPDWPKCFGYYIPPTDRADLDWQPERDYAAGQVIIYQQALLVAKSDFRSSTSFQEHLWEPYTRHDYAEFNAFHTWTEFINRLIGALAGLATLVLALVSFRVWKKDRILTLGAWLVVFAMGFQAWLGATVVYSVLAPAKITVHMVMALAIVGLLVYLLFRSREDLGQQLADPLTRRILWMALVMTLVQVILGTQVRQFVDEQKDLLGAGNRDLWLQDPDLIFYIHRSFSILVTLLNIWLFFRLRKLGLGLRKMNGVLALIALEISTGLAMAYLDFPFSSQPLHLVFASLLFGLQFYLAMELSYRGKTLNSSYL